MGEGGEGWGVCELVGGGIGFDGGGVGVGLGFLVWAVGWCFGLVGFCVVWCVWGVRLAVTVGDAVGWSVSSGCVGGEGEGGLES